MGVEVGVGAAVVGVAVGPGLAGGTVAVSGLVGLTVTPRKATGVAVGVLRASKLQPANPKLNKMALKKINVACLHGNRHALVLTLSRPLRKTISRRSFL